MQAGWDSWRFAIITLLQPGSRTLALDPARDRSRNLCTESGKRSRVFPSRRFIRSVKPATAISRLGTLTGLVRFDGVRFTAVREAGGVSLEKLWIHDLVADRDRGLWVATDHSGLLYLRDDAITRFTTHEGLPSDNIPLSSV